MYHFLAGYTAKVAGTEAGVAEPQATFSPFFGAPFMALPPSTYARLLGEKIQKHNVAVWLINTGWSGVLTETVSESSSPSLARS
jgi:phosphoenolpyruvate carboxykinase (ATP)